MLEAARAVRPYLAALTGPRAGALDAKLAQGLAASHAGQDATAFLRTVLESDDVTSAFLEAVLADAPKHRPPDLQPANPRGAPADTGMQLPPGDVGPVLHAGKWACPLGDYVWYRPAIGTPVPPCPTHGPGLAPV